MTVVPEGVSVGVVEGVADNDLELSPNYLIIKQSSFPEPVPHPGEHDYDEDWPVPCAKVLGAARNRPKAFRPQSVVNISAMSYGSLSPPAVEALNRGAEQCGCMHNTGEGGVSDYHRSGGDLVWQLLARASLLGTAVEPVPFALSDAISPPPTADGGQSGTTV